MHWRNQTLRAQIFRLFLRKSRLFQLPYNVYELTFKLTENFYQYMSCFREGDESFFARHIKYKMKEFAKVTKQLD